MEEENRVIRTDAVKETKQLSAALAEVASSVTENRRKNLPHCAT